MFCIKLAVCLDPIPWTYFSLYLFCTQTVCVLFSLLPGDSPALDFLESLSEPISCFSWLQSTNQLCLFPVWACFPIPNCCNPLQSHATLFSLSPTLCRGWKTGLALRVLCHRACRSCRPSTEECVNVSKCRHFDQYPQLSLCPCLLCSGAQMIYLMHIFRNEASPWPIYTFPSPASLFPPIFFPPDWDGRGGK